MIRIDFSAARRLQLPCVTPLQIFGIVLVLSWLCAQFAFVTPASRRPCSTGRVLEPVSFGVRQPGCRFYSFAGSINPPATQETPPIILSPRLLRPKDLNFQFAHRLWSVDFLSSAIHLHEFRSSSFVFRFALPVTSHDSPITAVHEWGTFTSIAGPDGLAMDWLPLTGSTDLPSFVEHLQNANLKGGLRGTIRMETPVLYFYSLRETDVSVHASFSKGLITEWYPRASVPTLNPRRDFTLEHKETEGAITWNSVHIQPAAPANFPTDTSDNHYYAARQTSSAPLTVEAPAGPQHEKFLFYRGVSAVLPPLTASLSPDSTVLLQNHFPEPIPNVILFERRGAQLSYRILGPITDQASFAPPALDDSLESLFSDLEGLLISQGLYADEAHAMLETWKSSWFEEGSRLLYIVPRPFVDSALPLTITPAPAQIMRVFVGRLELITPATQQAVESAFASGDRATLAKYHRFLEPILRTMFQSATDQPTRDRLDVYLDSVYADLYSQRQN